MSLIFILTNRCCQPSSLSTSSSLSWSVSLPSFSLSLDTDPDSSPSLDQVLFVNIHVQRIRIRFRQILWIWINNTGTSKYIYSLVDKLTMTHVVVKPASYCGGENLRNTIVNNRRNRVRQKIREIEIRRFWGSVIYWVSLYLQYILSDSVLLRVILCI